MKVGITLPQFRPSSEPALAAARLAEDEGLDGVFVFDHIWAIGQPDRPARNVWPLLGALASETERIHLGPLVARVSLLANAVLVHNFESLRRMVGPRLIAGIGAGDRLSKEENEALGLPFPPVDERIADLRAVARAVRALGIPTWIGGTSDRVHAVAVAEADALNLWDVPPERVAAVSDVEVTWGGAVPDTLVATADLLRRLAEAGATWAVCAPPYRNVVDPADAVRIVTEAAEALR